MYSKNLSATNSVVLPQLDKSDDKLPLTLIIFNQGSSTNYVIRSVTSCPIFGGSLESP